MKLGIILGAVGICVAGAAAAAVLMRPAHPTSTLIGDDYGRLRRDALAMFPRGMPVTDVAGTLRSMGFVCTPIRHLVANINAPSVQCDSSGRNYPVASRIVVTVLARNGGLSDVAVGNGFDAIEASALMPDPPSLAAPAGKEGGKEGGKPSEKEAAAKQVGKEAEPGPPAR